MKCFNQAVERIQRHHHRILRIASGDHSEISIIDNLIYDLLELISSIRKINYSV
jgi:hypothetical protein